MFGYITMLRGSPVFNSFSAGITDMVENIQIIHTENGKEGGWGKGPAGLRIL